MIRRRVWLVAGLALLGPAAALVALGQQPAPGKRYAVLVGVKDYDHATLKPLDFPENDVDERAALLPKDKYEVTLLPNSAHRREARRFPTLTKIEARHAEGNDRPGDDKQYVSKATGMKFVRIPKGTFAMGSPEGEKDRSNEETQHEVTLTKDYYLGVHEVTRGQFRKFAEDDGYKTEAETDDEGGYGFDAASGKLEGQKAKYNWRSTGFAQTDEHPVVNVTWNDAVRFAAWLSRKDGREYRLPTEAEWEYACRGGSTSPYCFGDDEEGLARHGNVADASARAKFPDWAAIKADDGYAFTAPVGRFRKNGFGLCDMHGNAWEWCGDWSGDYPAGRVTDPTGPATGSDRVYRGGGWFSEAGYCRSANRYWFDPSHRSSSLGFRLALVPSGR